MARQAKFDQGYDVRQEGDRRVIGFRGDGLPWSAWVIFPLAFLSVVWLFATPFWIVPVALISGIGYLTYLTLQRQEFTLTPGSIVKRGVEYDLSRVSEVLIDNPMDKTVSITAMPGIVVGGTGLMGASTAAVGVMASAATSAVVGAAAANARAAAKRRFRVRIRYGAKLVTLARNLKEDHAISIFALLTE
jgi:hypothetical protein